jgi:trigger factor
MKIEALKKDKLNHEYKVIMDDAEIQQKMDARLKEISQTVKMKGFRPGKAPLNMVRAQYGEALKGEILERAVNDGATQAINENELRPAMQPKIEVNSFEDGKGLEFTMSVELLPEIKLMDFKKVSLTRKTAEPDAKTIAEALERVAENQKTSKPVEEKRALKKGDIAIINFDGKVDGERRPGMKGEGHPLELGSASFIPGFEEQLIGKKTDDKVEVKVTFPEDYGSTELAGKEAVFDVEVKDIHKPVKPEIDDDFAKSLGFDDKKALEEAIKDQMQREYDQMSRMHLKRDLLDALDEAHKFDLPHGMVHAEEHNILHQVADQMKIKESEIADSEKKEYADIAARRVKLGLVLAEVGRENKIEINQQELQQAVIREAQRYPGQEQQVFEMYQKNPQALESLKAPLFEDKVVDFILEIATLDDNQVSVDELMKDPDEDASEAKPASKKKPAAKKDAKSKESGTKSKAKAKSSK